VRKLDLFGRPFFVDRIGTDWAIYYPGAEGKRGPLLDLPIPHFINTYDDLAKYLADLCHEWATPLHPDVRWSD
jgi:hypothetical protein